MKPLVFVYGLIYKTFFKKNSQYTGKYKGCYCSYEKKKNRFGGMRVVNIWFHNDDIGLHRMITDMTGRFVFGPGMIKDGWEEDVVLPGFLIFMEFDFSFYPPEDGKFPFYWNVQPDGWYFADSDGFGADNSWSEIRLKTYLDERGRFAQPFAYTWDRRC